MAATGDTWGVGGALGNSSVQNNTTTRATSKPTMQRAKFVANFNRITSFAD
jgi:hypothetical protein